MAYNVRDPKECQWGLPAWGENNPDGTPMTQGDNIITIVATGEEWSYYDALEKGIIYDPKSPFTKQQESK